MHDALDVLFAAYPVFATEAGYHALDDRWPDLAEEARQRLVRRLGELVDAARALPEADLSADERIDRGILVEALEGVIFDEDVLRESAWDPLGVVQVAGSGLFELVARDATPWPQRGLAFTWRVARLGDFLAGARSALRGLPDRPVSLLHTETALAQLGGVMEQVDEGVAIAAATDDGGLHLAEHLTALRPHVEAAVEAYRRFLTDEVRPRAQGEGRLGRRLFAEKLRHTLASDLGPDEVEARARHDYAVVRAELVRLARVAWPTWRPDAAMPEDEDALVRGVLDAIAAEHGEPAGLLDDARAEVAHIEAFVRERGLISLPDEPLEITWTPTFMRAYGGAFLSPPGPLEVGQRSYFWITPPGDDWPPERLESFLREDNERMQRLLCIHEAIPGHYLQLAAAARTPEPDPQHLPVRHVRRGVGGLRHPGDDGRRLRRPRTRPAAQPLEVLPAGDRQRAARRGHPHGRHDRGGGHGPDGPRRLPGGAGGAGQVAAGAAHGDAAQHVLHGLARVLGPRAGGATPGRRGGRGRRVGGARAARRG